MCKMALFISHVTLLSPAGRTLSMPCPGCLFLGVFYLLYPVKKRVLWSDFEIEFKNSTIFKTTFVLSCQLREKNKPTAPHRANQCFVQGRHRSEAQGQRLRPRTVIRRWGSCFGGDSHKKKWVYSLLVLFLLLLWTPLKGSRGRALPCLCAAAFQEL